MAAVGVVLGLGVVGWAVRQLWSAPYLVLGLEGLQVCRWVSQVLMDIPYRNIASITYQNAERSRECANRAHRPV